jgi:hypothetical protein
MSKRRLAARSRLRFAVLGAAIACAGSAGATIYTDNVGAAEHFSDSWADIASVEVTNDATNITFVVNLNPLMNDGVTANDITTNNFTNYDIGFDTVAGGSTTLQGAYDQLMGLSTGMDFWLRSWANGDGPPSTIGGFQLFKWDGATWGNPIITNTTAPITATSTTLTIPLASLELSNGSAFNFDVWTTFSQGAQGAYDALANPVRTPEFPFPNPTTTPYDGASGANYATTVYTVVGGATSAQWTGAIDANWSNAGNWTGGVPDGVGHTASFGGAGSTNFAVAVDVAPRVLGTISFDNAATFTIGSNGGNGVTLQVSTGQANINVISGSHTIAAPLTLASDTTVTVAPAGSSLELTGNMTAAGRAIVKAGAGTTRFENVRAAELSVTGGVARISAKAAPNSPSGTSVVQSLAVSSGAQLDLTNNSMVIDYSGAVGALVDDVRQHLFDGRLVSSSGVTDTTGLGYADNAALDAVKTSFGGQTVDASSVLIKFTYFGDTDVDGDVDVADLGKLATCWQGAGVWSGGDFDYNGSVNVNDLGLLATNWQAGVGNPLGPDLASALASFGLPAFSVPEPTMAGMLLLIPWSLKRLGRASPPRSAPR